MICPPLVARILFNSCERGSVTITPNLPFDEWTEVFGSERLTDAILDRLPHHVHILEMNGESFSLRQGRKAQACLHNNGCSSALGSGHRAGRGR
jgi:DNA replication protein DnaC